MGCINKVNELGNGSNISIFGSNSSGVHVISLKPNIEFDVTLLVKYCCKYDYNIYMYVFCYLNFYSMNKTYTI